MVIGDVAPELACVTARFAALAPFARVADLLSELLPIGGAANAGMVRNRTMRVGARVAKSAPAVAQMTPSSTVTPAVIVGLDGGYVRSRHRRPERNFEVIIGKVIGLGGEQHRLAFARNSASAEPFACTLARIGVSGRTPATVLSDGDAGLRNLQRRVLPEAPVELDWFHIAMRFEHTLRAAGGLGAETPNAWLGEQRRRDTDSAKWRLWHGRWKSCLVKLAAVHQWLRAESIRNIAGVRALRGHIDDLLSYLEANQSALVNYRARRQRGEPISTAFVESAVNEIIAKRMIKKQQMRWNRWTVQPSSMFASPSSTALWRSRSGQSIPASARPMTHTPRRRPQLEPHHLACSPHRSPASSASRRRASITRPICGRRAVGEPRIESAPLGIKVTIVEPGPFRADWAGRSIIESKTVIDDYDAAAGERRRQTRARSGNQAGDPVPQRLKLLLREVERGPNAGSSRLRPEAKPAQANPTEPCAFSTSLKSMGRFTSSSDSDRQDWTTKTKQRPGMG